MKKVCIINTGGTLGMNRGSKGYQAENGFLAKQLVSIPELARPEMPNYEILNFDPVMDSSDMMPNDWQKIAGRIHEHYDEFDGFVIVHGTDTMAYTASALSFMLQGLNKTVILTGSQIPLSEVRNDARENLITALMVAADFDVPEVCVLFGEHLLRGCRTTKYSASSFNAFVSPNYPALGTVGTRITLNDQSIRRQAEPTELSIKKIDAQEVATFRLFPGVSAAVLRNLLQQPLKALVLESFGVGNGPTTNPDFTNAIREATENGTIVVNCSQCTHGSVRQTNYATGTALSEAGAVSGSDLTIESAIAKLLFLFTCELPIEEIKSKMQVNMVGELTPEEN